MLVKYATAHIQHMQKALDLMNIHIHKAISDITGLTGMRIIRAILAGEQNPAVLAEMRDPRIRCSKHELVQALQGDYRPEHLFTLRQALSLYEFYWQQIVECDKQIEACLTHLGAFYRRIKSRLGAKAAITATAHKIAIIYYNMLKYGRDYIDHGQDYYDRRYKDRVIKGLQRKAAAMCYHLVESPQPLQSVT